MKMVIITLVIVSLLSLDAGAEDSGRLHVRQGMNGEPVVAIDILEAFRNERVQEAGTLAKLPVALWEGTKATGRYAVDSPGNFAKSAIVGYLVFRGAQGKLDDDWNSLRRRTGLKSSSGSSDGNSSRADSDDAQSVMIVDIKGNGNTVNIINQQPQGSNTGATPNLLNTGGGGETLED